MNTPEAPAKPPKMTTEEETELEWYLGSGTVEFFRSTTGTMLERAKAFSPRRVSDEQGKLLSDKYDRRVAHPARRRFMVARGAQMQEHDAQPTAEVQTPGGTEPTIKVLMRYALVSRRLARVDARSIEAGKVLRVYYGDSGARWGRTKHGRIFSLYGSTEAGAALVRRVEKVERSPVFLPFDERLGVIAALQSIPNQSKAWRRLALAEADRQAWAMYGAARKCWQEVGRA